MASSGTIQAAIRTGYRIQIAWEVTSQSVANNTSTVRARVQLVSTGSSYTINSSASKSGNLTINGTKYSFTFSAALSGNQTKTLYTKTVTISHASDGEKTCSFSCSCGINVTLSGTYYGSVTASGSGVFDTIARASSISSVTASVSVNGTNACTVNISRKSSSFTHTVTWKFGSYSRTNTDVGTSTSYAIPMTWLNAMPNATTGTGTVTITTYSGSTKIGASVSRSFKLTAPSSVVPSISALTVSESVSGLAVQFGGYVQNKSRLAVSVTANGIYGSTIKAYKTTILGKSYTTRTFTSSVLTSSGSVNVVATVTDSRGRTASRTSTVTVLAYAPPTIATLTAIRANGLGSADDNGTMALARIKFSIATVGNKNTKSYVVEYRLKSSTTWTQATTGSVYSYDSNMLLSINLDPDASYDIRLSITDFFTTVRAVVDISTTFTLLDFHANGKALAFGKVCERTDGVEFALPAYFSNGESPDGAIPIASGTDCNNLMAAGYYSFSSAVLATMKNNPVTVGASGSIIVLKTGADGQLMQIAVRCSEGNFELYERMYYSSQWWEWYEIAGHDTGWKNATLTSAFETYGDSVGNTLQYRRKGGVVYLSGVVTPTATITGGTENITITTLPEGYRPPYQRNFVCQGSGACLWLCTITSSGLVRFARYRNGSAWDDAAANTWLPIDVSFMV